MERADQEAACGDPEALRDRGKPLAEKTIYMHFFIGSSDWYIAEFDGDDIFFGYEILGGDEQNAEWGVCLISGDEGHQDTAWI